MLGKLYIVATPIGNLEDMSLRGVRTLKEVDFILTEDSRVTQKLLKHYDIETPILIYHQHSPDSRRLEILKHLVEGKNLALVTDAGTPGVSDPGNELISFVIEREPEIQIVCIPGSSALTAALSVSGLNINRFLFSGFLPKKGRQKIFTQVKESHLPLVFFESPHRMVKTLETLIDFFGPQKEVVVCQELTKIHERVLRGSLRQVKKELIEQASHLGRVKGEAVVILN